MTAHSLVITTAGHVDHGKTTLVKALTGTDTDRLAEEKQRGLSIELGFAYLSLPSGHAVSFVDVPGHEKFFPTTIAGLGPSSVVCFVVAADAGWQPQSSDHRDALHALGIREGFVVITRSDVAPDNIPAVSARIRREFSHTALAEVPIIPASGVTGEGLEEIRQACTDIAQRCEAAGSNSERPVRLWIDRSFSLRGAGTVITGTHTMGAIHTGDELSLLGADAAHAAVKQNIRAGTASGLERPVHIRGMQIHNSPVTSAYPVCRLALNLRNIAAEDLARGDVLITPGAWWLSREWDIRVCGDFDLSTLPQEVMVYCGTTAEHVRLRAFDSQTARLRGNRALPLSLGERLLLRVPGQPGVVGGVTVLDVAPPALRRRGAKHKRARQLASWSGCLSDYTRLYGAVNLAELRRQGVDVSTSVATPGHEVVVAHGWALDQAQLKRWRERVIALMRDRATSHPLDRGLPVRALAHQLGIGEAALLSEILRGSELCIRDGRVEPKHMRRHLGEAESSVVALERRLQNAPFAAPEAEELQQLRLGTRELAAAMHRERLLCLPAHEAKTSRSKGGKPPVHGVASGTIVLLPDAPQLAVEKLAELTQPFTLSQARQALQTTRRVVIPLLEYTDRHGLTERVDTSHRRVLP